LWVWGFGDWPKSPIPNPQSPIPNPQSPILFLLIKNSFNNKNIELEYLIVKIILNE